MFRLKPVKCVHGIMDTGKQFPQVCFVEIKESGRIFRPQIGKRLVVSVEHGVGRMHLIKAYRLAIGSKGKAEFLVAVDDGGQHVQERRVQFQIVHFQLGF